MRVLYQGGRGGGGGKQPSDWTIIQDGGSACDWTIIQDGRWNRTGLNKMKLSDWSKLDTLQDATYASILEHCDHNALQDITGSHPDTPQDVTVTTATNAEYTLSSVCDQGLQDVANVPLAMSDVTMVVSSTKEDNQTITGDSLSGKLGPHTRTGY